MPRVLTSHKGQRFTISDKPIHSGGEGAIHEVIGTGTNLVAKIYHTPQKAQSFYQKILFMVNNPPFGQAPKEIRDAIIWPTDLLFENNVFVGYVMPKVDTGIKLFELTLPRSPQQKHGSQWHKFDFSSPDALLVRMKICYNLARAIEVLHQSGNYVLVDLKPENVLIKPNGHFSIIDLDSIQITQQKQLLFRATAFTPEYAPPEFHNGQLSFSKDIITAKFDHFSFAVIMYQMIFSIHPFQASHSNFTTLDENIKHGLFVHGSKKKQLLVIPTVHKRFASIPKDLQQLFLRALDHGTINPSFRPTPNEWAKEFLNEINSFALGKKNVYCSVVPGTQNTVNPKQNNNGFKRRRPITQPNTAPFFRPTIPNFGGGNQTYYTAPKKSNPMLKLLGKTASVIRDGLQKMPTGKQLAFKLFGAVFFAAAVWAVISILPVLFGNNDNDFKGQITNSQLHGKYYGFIDQIGSKRETAYIQIMQKEKNNANLTLRIITNVDEGSEFEELKVDKANGTINSKSLGLGTYRVDTDGSIRIMSAQNNSKLWYFKK